MLDEGNDAAGHEPRRTDGLTGARDLDYLDDTAAGGDLHAPTRTRGDDLVGPGTVVRSHYDFDAITLHMSSVVRGVDDNPADRRASPSQPIERRTPLRAGNDPPSSELIQPPVRVVGIL